MQIIFAILCFALAQLWASPGFADGAAGQGQDNKIETALFTNVPPYSSPEPALGSQLKIVPVAKRRVVGSDNNNNSLSWVAVIVAGFIVVLVFLSGKRNKSSTEKSSNLEGHLDEWYSKRDESPPVISSQSENLLGEASRIEGAPEAYKQSEPAPKSMVLKLKRSQRPTNITGRIIFVLDARIALSADEYSLVRKYRLGTMVVYDSKARTRYADAMEAHLEMARGHTQEESALLSAGKSLYRFGRASLSFTMAALSLHITVDRLVSGVHIECKSMDELLEAENAILQAGRNLKAYLNTAVTFDGREELIEL